MSGIHRAQKWTDLHKTAPWYAPCVRANTLWLDATGAIPEGWCDIQKPRHKQRSSRAMRTYRSCWQAWCACGNFVLWAVPQSLCTRRGYAPWGPRDGPRQPALTRGACQTTEAARSAGRAVLDRAECVELTVRFVVCGHRCARALGRNGVPSQQKPQRGICTSPLLAMFMAGRCAANMYMCSSWRLACFGSAFSVSTLLTDTALEGLANLHDVDSCGVPNAHKASSI